MPIIKSIPIHSIGGIKACISYTTDNGKTAVFERENGTELKIFYDNEGNVLNSEAVIGNDIEKVLNYAENIEKTALVFDGDEDILVSGFNCNPDTAAYEFLDLKYEYEDRLLERGIDPASRIRGKKNGTGVNKGELVDKQAREAYHIIMSFDKRPDLSPNLVHLIGMEFCKSAFPDTKAVVSTHMNTEHLHNHIVRSAYNMSNATKYRDTLQNLEKMREISDMLSLKYGIDIILEREHENKHGHSYTEEQERKRGCSWKDILKQDIEKSYSVSKSWKEFKETLALAGYGVMERPSGVTYYFLDNENRRIRDKSLGTDFTRDFIKREYGEPVLTVNDENREEKSISKKNKNISRESTVKITKHKNEGINLFIPRYTVTGRRRSDLELMFLAASKLINHYSGKVTDSGKKELAPDNLPSHDNARSNDAKIKAMKQGMEFTKLMGIGDEEHLKQVKNLCGAKKSEYAKELGITGGILNAMTVLDNKAENLLALMEEAKIRGLDTKELFSLSYSEKQKRDNMALLMPMNKMMRRELYLALSEKGYKVSVKYDNISMEEGRNILDYLSGKQTEKPDILFSEREFLAKGYTKGDDDRGADIENDERNKLFDKSVKNLSDDDKLLMYRIRLLKNELLSYGYAPKDIEKISDKTKELSSKYLDLKEKVREYSLEYRNLSRLEHNLALAKDSIYTYSLGENVNIVIEEPENEKVAEKDAKTDDLQKKEDWEDERQLNKDYTISVSDSHLDHDEGIRH